MIKCQHIRCAYVEDRPVLQDISFVLDKGERVGLIGPNGAGKSTLLRILVGLLPYEGSVYIDGILSGKKTLPEIRKRLGLVMQSSENQLFMPTVYEDLVFGPRNYGLSVQEADERAEAALTRLGIGHLRDRRNHELSGGEQKLAAIAAILAMSPSAILMDEPTAGLDPWNRRQVIKAVQGLSQTLLITSHDLSFLEETCDRLILLSGTRIIADRPAHEMLSDTELLATHRLLA